MRKSKPAVAASVALKLPRPSKRKSNRSANNQHTTAAGRGLYAVHPGVAMVEKWIRDLSSKTGRTLQEWILLIKKQGPKVEKDCRAWLKEEFKLGTNTAWWLAEKTFGNALGLADDSPESYLRAAPIYVERMYAGPKAHLRVLHDRLIELTRSLGDDVRICPCQTIVPLYRRHVFAQIKPTTTKRIDLGFALGEEPFTSRLIDTGGMAKKDRITHRVAISEPSDIDLQVKRWLKQAYERDA
jgi:hypothetical protein